MRKTVPKPDLVRTATRASCLSRIPFETQSPSPVPASPLVVTKGWNKRSNMYRSMPEPLSATVTDDTLLPVVILRGSHCENEAPFVRQGIEGIRNEVGEYLLNLSRLAQNRRRRAIAAFDRDVAKADDGIVKVDDRIDDFIERGEGRRGALTIKLQASRRDVRKPLQFLVGNFEQVPLSSTRAQHRSWPERAGWLRPPVDC